MSAWRDAGEDIAQFRASKWAATAVCCFVNNQFVFFPVKLNDLTKFKLQQIIR